MSKRRGVYFLANDYVLERVIAFLNSFRAYHPALPLCLIPFADDTEQLMKLQDKYEFSVWSGDPALLRACDDISRRFHSWTAGHYRKLVAWEGEYDEFIYIDTDMVVLRDMSFVFDYLDRFGFVTAVSHYPELFSWTWHESVYSSGALTPRQIEYAASTGFVASRKECLRFADATSRVPAALELKPHMVLATVEMPLLNYLMVASGWPYTSLRALAGGVGADPVPPGDIPIERHAGDSFVVRDGQVVSPASPPTLSVHWAGSWWEVQRGEIPQVPHHDLWSYYRFLE